MTTSTQQNYYQLLEITQDAPHHEIVKAYQRAKETYSPDSPALYTMFSKEEADALRLLIDEAFRILGNATKRREYDLTLKLPDFPPAEKRETVSTPSNNTTKPTASSVVVPEGFKKHKYGVYEVKKEIEDEIAACTDFNGAFLRKIRLYKNINLDQMSKETRISRTYLNAVENEEYEALPAAVFVRGFLVQMGRALSLDENKVASTYMQRFKK